MSATRRSRAVALALAALFVAGQAALFTHQLFVPHQVCAEHGGELIHVERTGAASASSEAPGYARAQWLGASHGHEHCSAFTPRREDTVAAARLGEAVVDVRSDTAPVAIASERSIPREVLLRLAPKNSPPV